MEMLLPLTITWLPLRMCVARSWNEALSMQRKTCRSDVNIVPLSSVTGGTVTCDKVFVRGCYSNLVMNVP